MGDSPGFVGASYARSALLWGREGGGGGGRAAALSACLRIGSGWERGRRLLRRRFFRGVDGASATVRKK